MSWIWLSIILAIVLKTIERGGDWFDFLEEQSRLGNQRKAFEFNFFFALLGCVLIAGLIWLYAVTMTPSTVGVAPSRATPRSND